MNEAIVHTQPHPITNRIGGVFMHVRNMERSVQWYHRLFGLPERSSATDKVHALPMNGGADFVLDQHGYDRGLAMGDRPLLMIDSPDVDAAYRHVQRLGIPIEWEIERYPGMAFFTFRDPDGNLLMVCGKPGSPESGGGADASGLQAPPASTVRYNGGGTWLTVHPDAYYASETRDGLVLKGRANTETTHATPLRIETTVRIEDGCLRLRYGPYGQLVFNYGPSSSNGTGIEFYVKHPKVDRDFDDLTKGAIPNGEWVGIEWTIEERSMEVRVNGELFHTQEGYFGGIVGTAGIGNDNGRITVKSFSVEALPERETLPRLTVLCDGTQADVLVPDVSCYPVLTGEGLWLTQNEQWGNALTKQAYAVPYAMEIVVRSDRRTLLLYGGVSAQVKFHANGALSFRDPVSKEEVWLDGAGTLSEGFQTIVWTMDADRTSIRVNGELRLERAGNYAECRYRLGVGADLGSAVTVKSVRVRTD
ncbi:VOC family protein [Paenibacillus sp. HJGM_3]|uniref:VOC family protein n=1 Tax=Paenibacillus sp. HJGM_3 TaxID=3379816 RepID=UPI003858E79B